MTPGSCHVHGIAVGRAAGRVGQQLDRRQPAAGPEAGEQRRRGGVEARAADAAQQERGEDARPRRARPVAAARPTGPRRGGARAGGGRRSRSRARSSAAPSGSDAWSSPLSAISGEKNPMPAAGSSIRPRERLAVEPAGDDVELGLPGRVVQGAALELAAAQEPVVREGRRRRRGQRRGAARGGAAGRGGCRPVSAATRRRRRRRSAGRSMDAAGGSTAGRRARLDRATAAGRGGTGSCPPCRGRSSTAAPSPRGRPAPRVVQRRAAPQAVEAWRGTATRAGRRHRVSRCGPTCPGGDMPSNAAGSISSASTSMPSMTRGPGRENSPDPSTANTRPSWTARSSAQPVGPRRPRPLGDRLGEPEPAGHQHEDLRVDLARAPPRSSRPTGRPPGRAAPSRRRGAPARGPSGRRANGGSSHSIAATRGGTNPWSRRPTTISSTACSRSRRPSTTSTAASSASVIAPDGLDRVEDPLDRDRLEADHRDVAVEPAGDLVDLAIADRADAAQLLGEDQVGLRRGERRRRRARTAPRGCASTPRPRR